MVGIHLSNNPGITVESKKRFSTILGVTLNTDDQVKKTHAFMYDHKHDLRRSHTNDFTEVLTASNRENVQMRRIQKEKQ